MKRLLRGLALSVAFGLAACGGSTPPDSIDISYDYGTDTLDGYTRDQVVTEGTRDPGLGDINCDEMIFDHADDPDDPLNGYDYIVTLGGQRDIRTLLTLCGHGVESEWVDFAVLDQSYEGVCELEASSGPSDVGGVAYTALKGGDHRGTCVVEACLDDGETCVTFNVLVMDKFVDPLVVKITDYTGDYISLDRAKVLLFKTVDSGSMTCDDVEDIENLPQQANTSSAEFDFRTTMAKFSTLKNLENEMTQTYTVLGKCWESTDLDKTVRAYGCKDNVVVEFGDSTYVELDCKDIPPRIVGSYELRSTFDMVSGLPPAIALVVNVIIGLFQNPTGEILLLMCDPEFGAVLGGGFCGYIFNDTNDPSLDNMGTVGSIVSTIMNAILMGLLADNCPAEDPETCTNIMTIGADVGAVLQKFQLGSTLTCTKEPDKNGLLPLGVCKEIWHTVFLKWTLGKDCDPSDDQCGVVTLSMSAIPGIDNAISANIEAQLLEDYKLAISKHPIDLKYGALVNFAIERILLPQVFGNGQDGLPAVDSYEDLIGSLLAGKQCIYGGTCCYDFAQSVLAQTGTLPGLTLNLIEGACDALISTGSQYLRDQLTALDATPQNFQIGTPIGDACQLYDNDKDMRFDAFGTKAKPCNWDASLTVGGAAYSPDGTFYGPPAQ